jgi:hypothetical protein
MRNLFFILLFVLTNCKEKQGEYIEVKNNILYKDKENNIYLKREIHLINKINDKHKKTRFFDCLIYKDSVIFLKNFVDVESFYFVNTTDTIGKIKTDIFKDKKHIYFFKNKPASFPLIVAKDL